MPKVSYEFQCGTKRTCKGLRAIHASMHVHFIQLQQKLVQEDMKSKIIPTHDSYEITTHDSYEITIAASEWDKFKVIAKSVSDNFIFED